MPLDLCDAAQQAGLSCPLYKGNHSINVTKDIPYLAPPVSPMGSYGLDYWWGFVRWCRTLRSTRKLILLLKPNSLLWLSMGCLLMSKVPQAKSVTKLSVCWEEGTRGNKRKKYKLYIVLFWMIKQFDKIISVSFVCLCRETTVGMQKQQIRMARNSLVWMQNSPFSLPSVNNLQKLLCLLLSRPAEFCIYTCTWHDLMIMWCHHNIAAIARSACALIIWF